MRILIVDDCPTTTIHMCGLLKQAGYPKTSVARDYCQAISMLHAAAQRRQPIDLILMDISLPGTDGIAATLTIKADKTFEDIPIVIVTNHNEESILDRSFAAGASDFIVKPVSMIELRARIRSVLQLREEMDKRKMRERELEALARKLEKMSNLDGLTGIANRRCFDDALVKEWVRNGRHDTPMALLMIDIDHFKAYNDTLGHVLGDDCLVAVAEGIMASIHRPGDMAARYGGEEFAVILPHTGYEGAHAVADTIHTNINGSNIHHPHSYAGYNVTVSIGVASCIPSCQTTPAQLLTAADTALYRAKQNGRNRTEVVCLGQTKW